MGYTATTNSIAQLSVYQKSWWGGLFGNGQQLDQLASWNMNMDLERILPSGRDRSAHRISK